jgi:predicted DCC family thiol-disulfide oxidoreductase YuxK
MPELALPDPDQKRGSPIVIWDGQCNFCQQQVGRLRRLDSNRLAYISLHDARVSRLCPELTHQQLMEQMWVVTADGREKYGGADAGRYLSIHLPKLWWLAPLLHIPFSRPFWSWMYRHVAKRRYRISGKNCDSGSCHIN